MSFKAILKYFLIWQVLIVFVVMVAGNLIPLRPSDTFLGASISGYLQNPLLNFRSNFDGVHYVLIATHGYNFGQQAFFPLYPSLIRAIYHLFESPILAGVLISSIAFLLALYFLNRLILLDCPPRVAKWTIWLLLAFPTSFFFSAVYTEGLFFLLVVLSFYLVRTGHPWLGSISAAFAGYTRLIGIFLLPALFFEILSQNRDLPVFKIMKKFIPLLIIPLGLLVYMNYLNETTGNPLIFYELQSSFRQGRSTELILPYQVLWRYVKMVFTVNSQDPLYLTIWLEFITGVVFSILSLVSLFRQRLSYAVFNFLAFILPTLTGIFTSLPRYVLVCFPVFLLLAQFISVRRSWRRLVLGTFMVFWVVYLALFSRGFWVA